MDSRSRWFFSSFLAFVGSLGMATTVIAQSRSVSLPANLPVNRISRDLTRSPSEDFFQQGRLQLEREIQHLAKNRELLNQEVLKVSPDQRSFPNEIKEQQEVEDERQR